MPVAQFWEKAVEVTPPTHYLARGKWASSEMGFSDGQREILAQIKPGKPMEYFVYFEDFAVRSWVKRAAAPAKSVFQ